MSFVTQAIHFIIQPWHVLLLLVALGLGLRALRRPRDASIAFFAACSFFAVVSFTPLADTLAYSLEDRLRPGEYDLDEVAGAIVLGGSTGSTDLAAKRGVTLVTGSGERLFAIASLRRQRPDLPVVVTGNANEAAMTRKILSEIGVDISSITFEDKSKTTFDSARNSSELLDKTPGRHLLVTSARHMPRTVASFRKAGMDVIPYPVDYRADPPSWSLARINPTDRFELLDDMMYEFAGLAAYRLTGKTDTLLPDN